MAGISVTEVWGSRVTSTMAVFLKTKPIDQIFSGNLLLGTLLGQESDTNKMTFPLREGRVIRQTGGRKIRLPLSYLASSNTTSFRGADELSLNIDDIHTMAEAQWSYYTDAVVVTWQEAQENSGEAAMFSLVQERTVNAMRSIKDMVDSHLGSTGDAVSVGNGGKNIIGLQHLLSADPTTGMVWGVNRVTYTWWRHNLITAGDTFANIGIAALAEAWTTQSGTNGEDPPTLWLTTAAQWRAYHAKVAALQQVNTIQVSGAADLGFPALEFMGRPVFYDANTPANVWYGLNLNYFVACLQTGAEFKVEPYGKGSGRQMLDGIWRLAFGAQIGIERFDRQSRTLFTG